MRHLGDFSKPTGAGLARTIVLVGLMGAGKTSVGRRLAVRLKTAFHDADDAIVDAAGMSIPDIFEMYGETEFRDLERRVIARLMKQPPHILALGGGAFIDPETRRIIKQRGTSIWLKADLPTLVARTAKKANSRPLLMTGDPKIILGELMERRYPIYALADHHIETSDGPLDASVDRIVDTLASPGPVHSHA